MKTLIRQEIEWCKKNKGMSGKSKEFEKGFIAGLEQAARLERLEKKAIKEATKCLK